MLPRRVGRQEASEARVIASRAGAVEPVALVSDAEASAIGQRGVRPAEHAPLRVVDVVLQHGPVLVEHLGNGAVRRKRVVAHRAVDAGCGQPRSAVVVDRPALPGRLPQHRRQFTLHGVVEGRHAVLGAACAAAHQVVGVFNPLSVALHGGQRAAHVPFVARHALRPLGAGEPPVRIVGQRGHADLRILPQRVHGIFRRLSVRDLADAVPRRVVNRLGHRAVRGRRARQLLHHVVFVEPYALRRLISRQQPPLVVAHPVEGKQRSVCGAVFDARKPVSLVAVVDRSAVAQRLLLQASLQVIAACRQCLSLEGLHALNLPL